MHDFIGALIECVVSTRSVMNMNYLIDHFDVLNYGKLAAFVGGGFVLTLGFYMFLSYRQNKEAYNHMVPRIRRYHRGLKKMKNFYMIEDKQQRDFEKGEWRNGQ
jgi:hypothetical protein